MHPALELSTACCMLQCMLALQHLLVQSSAVHEAGTGDIGMLPGSHNSPFSMRQCVFDTQQWRKLPQVFPRRFFQAASGQCRG